MKTFLRKSLSLVLAAALLGASVVTAEASEALGEDLTSEEILLNQDTALSTSVFWSTSYADLRTENIITYSPNEDVTPIVTYGNVLTGRSTISAAAKKLEAEGYRVVAGINGDFYNTSTGLPIGLVVTEGRLRSSDAGYYAIGFRADGTAVLGKPQVKVTADLGYQRTDSAGYSAQVVRNVAGVNKARVSTGGIYLYTYDFNDRHTTGTTEPGVDVLCTVVDGELSIGSSVTVMAEEVRDGVSVTSIGEDQIVLTANAKSDSYFTDALREIQPGTELTITLEASSEAWNDVDYAVGALYSLVENGAVASGLAAGMNPRTAVGQRADGSLVFYTIDGRKSGHSIGASLSQVAARLIELGCVTALCLDGGGSTTLTVTTPDATAAKTVNTPSEGSERAVTNQLFLVADSQPTGRLHHFYVNADSQYVLAGSRVHISASAVDTNYIPMAKSYSLTTDGGHLEGDVLVTPKEGGDITVTASSGSKKGSTTVHAIVKADDIAVRNASGAIITTLSAVPGTTVNLSATVAYNHLPLTADADCFTWAVTGGIGTITQDGKFTAGSPGTGTITVTGGGRTASVDVTVSRIALHTVETFEGADLSDTFADIGGGISITRATGGDYVRLGRGSGKLSYRLNGSGIATSGGYYTFSDVYTSLNLWVYGDGSGNTLSLLTSDGLTETETAAAELDFTGWKQITVDLPAGTNALTGLRITGAGETTIDPETLEETVHYPSAVGVIWVDQIVASYGGAVDNTVPAITLQADGTTLTGTVTDGVDGVLPRSAVSVTWDGQPQTFSYNTTTGAFSTSLVSDGQPHRVTVTARDASGNIGRASYDLPQGEDWTPSFSDTQDYWASAYVEYLYNAGITNGYADGTFRPGKNISRQEFAVMLYRYLGLKEADYADVTLPFADLGSIGEFAIPAVKALFTEGIINGTTGKDGKLYFNPGSSLTRAQAAAMIGRTQEKGYAAVELTFTDAASIPAYARYYVQTMAAQGIIGGYADGSFKPNANITRGQMAKILYNLL